MPVSCPYLSHLYFNHGNKKMEEGKKRKRHRTCFCSKCGLGGKRVRYETAARHRRIYCDPGEEKAPIPVPVEVEEEEEEDDDQKREVTDAEIVEIRDKFILLSVDKQVRLHETQTSLLETLATLSDKNIRRVLDTRFVEGLPTTYYSALKIIDKSSFEPKRIPMCVNNCVLFRKEWAQSHHCPVCHEPR